MPAASRPLILVDGSAYLFRAFHAMERQGREFSTASGQRTETVKVVLNMLRKLVISYRPELMAVVFDAKGKTFRDDLYPEYKATRSPKTAAKWLAAHGDLDTIIANADSVKGKIGEKLRDALDTLPLSRTLTTIKTDVELPQPVAELCLRAPDIEHLASLYDLYEFRGWRDEINAGYSPLSAHKAMSQPVNPPMSPPRKATRILNGMLLKTSSIAMRYLQPSSHCWNAPTQTL